ncbi:hypothetical protein O7635_06965 [Asanoa sp. WMMD1127]|uniref:hypothetical protein n=1 Tax=Asanoa sp. WMMD1127 TaxID=3016107 RepID=UPI002417D861|nr:hypothetical protein [Asanoa sp. WMMD1127]MDG4821593.1 hypothetical protein [Asanoa sp. WMMD1127]
MTSTMVDPSGKVAQSSPHWSRLRVGQVVVAQAAMAGVLATLDRGPLLLGTACALGAVTVVAALARVRGRWLFVWLGIGLRYATRRRLLPAPSADRGLMRFVAPDVALTDDGAFVDADGLLVVFELDEPVVASDPTQLPDLGDLLVGHRGPPRARIELLISAEGQGAVPALRRVFVVLRVNGPPDWSDGDLRPTLTGLARRVARRIGPHHRLDRESALATVAELLRHDGRHGVEERWSFVVIGGLRQAIYWLAGHESQHACGVAARLLTIPAAAVVLAVSHDRLVVRLACESPERLEHADRALHQLAAAEQLRVERLDGEHLVATTQTLPFSGHSGSLGLPSGPTIGLGGTGSVGFGFVGRGLARHGPSGHGPSGHGPSGHGPSGHGPSGHGAGGHGAGGHGAGGVRSERQAASSSPSDRRSRPSPRPRRAPPVEWLPEAPARPPSGLLPPAGMVLGRDRHGSWVVARAFRPAGTRILVVGGLGAGQLIALRALASGARIDVRTRRWGAWNELAQAIAAPVDSMRVIPDAAPVHRWVTAGDLPRAGRPSLTILDIAAAKVSTPAAVSAVGTALLSREAPRATATRRHVLEVGREDQPSEEQAVGGGDDAAQRARWQTVLTLRDDVVDADAALLREADVVVLQALRPEGAAAAAASLGLADGSTGWLSQMPDDVIAVVSSGRLQWARMGVTPAERFAMGMRTE